MLNRLFAVIFLHVSWCAAATKDAPLPESFRGWLGAQQEAVDMRVPFRMTRTLPTLKSPVSESGIFWRLADGRFRWQIGDPPASILLFASGELKSWEKSSNHWRVLDPNDRRSRMWMGFLSGKDMEKENLEKNFSVQVNGETATGINVSMMPKSASVRRHISQIDLTIHQQEKRLLILRVIQADGSTMQMDFAKPQKVTTADLARFSQP